MAKGLQPTLSRVRVSSLTDQVWSQLRTQILNNQLPPGTRLVELDIASQMGVSQGSTREALQRLERDGLVERGGRSGTFVTAVSVNEMYEIFAVRSMVEQFAIRHTIVGIHSRQLDDLEALIEAMRDAGDAGDIISLVEHDLKFHQQIVQWSHHTTLLRVWLPLYMQVQRFIVSTHPHYFHDLKEIANTHVPLLDALRGGAPDRAAARIEEHIMLIWSRIETERAAVTSPAGPERRDS